MSTARFAAACAKASARQGAKRLQHSHRLTSVRRPAHSDLQSSTDRLAFQLLTPGNLPHAHGVAHRAMSTASRASKMAQDLLAARFAAACAKTTAGQAAKRLQHEETSTFPSHMITWF